MCWGVHPTASDVLLIRFLNTMLNQSPCFWGVPCRTSSSLKLSPHVYCQGTKVSLLLMELCNPMLDDCFFHTSCTFLLPFLCPILPWGQIHSSSSYLLALLLSAVFILPNHSSSTDPCFCYLVTSSGTQWWWSPYEGISPSIWMGQNVALRNMP